MRSIAFKSLSYLLVVAIIHLGLFTSAHSVMVSTDQVVHQQYSAADPKARIANLLDRAEVREQLAKLGISQDEALARVSAMTDEEARNAAGKLDQLPAGGDGLGTLIGAAVLIFIVLLITDILGFTKVFPFTKPIKR